MIVLHYILYYILYNNITYCLKLHIILHIVSFIIRAMRCDGGTGHLPGRAGSILLTGRGQRPAHQQTVHASADHQQQFPGKLEHHRPANQIPTTSPVRPKLLAFILRRTIDGRRTGRHYTCSGASSNQYLMWVCFSFCSVYRNFHDSPQFV